AVNREIDFRRDLRAVRLHVRGDVGDLQVAVNEQTDDGKDHEHDRERRRGRGILREAEQPEVHRAEVDGDDDPEDRADDHRTHHPQEQHEHHHEEDRGDEHPSELGEGQLRERRVESPFGAPPVSRWTQGFSHPLSASSRSASRSIAASMPTLSRKKPSGMPISALWADVMWVCDVNLGSETSESTPPRLGAWRNTLSLRTTRSAAFAPPASSIAIIPPNPSSISFATAWSGCDARPG